ncbi:TPA: plasmid mobilization relaxosome protein MobC [Pseudomonas aeruginosa]|nr:MULTISPECIES: plasmid mobilization relaxosome protein MobC [Pseudomonas]MBH3381219.1 plasmid mobilization relaxosome protein MobC [Pseudomonas asiatica]MBS6037571.1 plasmid mobilization relaxosome protein MobC [Pseudomonas sp.]
MSTPDVEKRKKRLSVFFHDYEYTAVMREAKSMNIRPSALVRNKLLTGVSAVKVPEINLEAWRKLARAAANLNQITRFLNEGMRLDVDELSRVLAEFRLAIVTASGQK